MKAAQHTKYHKDNITVTITEIEKPKITSEQVLVRVKAAGVNPLDNMISRGEVKLIVPYASPQTAGNEFVGVVEEVGNQVKNFKLGERVFARLPLDSIGAFAEYIAVDSEALAKVPEYLSDVEAAAIPLTALTIMQALELMKAEAGKTIFISGGTGGVGGMAIPIAKAKGLTVITNGVLPATDGEIQKRIPSIFKKAGIKIINKVRASEITQENGKLKVSAKRVDKDKVEEAEGTMVLLATGRKANIDGLEIEKAGVVTERGAVVTDKGFKTNVDHIYAIGDVVYGNVQLAHVASAQAIHVVEKLMGEHPEINLDIVPACTFTLPEVAQVGLTEEEVIAQNIPYVKSKFMFSGNGKAVSLGEADGFVKVIATEDLKKILGIHIIGPHANDLIHEGTVAMANDMGVESIGKMIHAHPTLSEAFMEAIHQLEGKSIHSAPAK